MNWTQHFAARTRLMKRTAVRELLKLTARPDVISFAGGLPAAELFPVARVRQAVAAVLERMGGQSLQYAETEGLAELRDWIARQFWRPQCRVVREHVLITSGGQQALDLVGRVFLDEGDRVVVENPTYLALLSAWRPLGVEFLPVPSDEQGLEVKALLPQLAQRPKLVYVTPNFQNPRGTTLAAGRRQTVVASLRQWRVPVVEDNPYGELRYNGFALPHLLELDAALASQSHDQPSAHLDTQVIHVGTFSKVLMPGLRIGWIIAPREVIDKLVQAKQSADLHTNTLSQYLALELVSHGFLDEFLPVLRQTYRARRDRMLAALEKHFPAQAIWTHPEGGMFVFVTLPQEVDASLILAKALEQKVAYVPGEEFHINGVGKNTIRLNFSNAKPDQIEEGIQRLGSIFRAECHHLQ